MYEEFAKVYDIFMETIPYEQWADYIEAIWKKHGEKPDLVCDLACGTGGLAIELSRRGYDMVGVDLSADMLEEAREKSAAEGEQILLVQQDMRQLELFGQVDAIICTCDSLNYLTEPGDLLAVFERVYQYLAAGGLFIFDMNTQYKYQEILSDNTFADTYDDAAFIWQNTYDVETGINEYLVNFFVEQEEDRYVRYEELHLQKAYAQNFILACIQKAGFHVEACYDELSWDAPHEKSERIHYVVRKQFDSWEE